MQMVRYFSQWDVVGSRSVAEFEFRVLAHVE
jgi:hypothetical protein